MADDLRHAAGRPIYEVREFLEGEPALDLGCRRECADFLEAVDFALEYLEEYDALREGKVSALEIVRVQGDERETVWTYSHSREPSVHQDLVGLWGFDVTHWHGPGRGS